MKLQKLKEDMRKADCDEKLTLLVFLTGRFKNNGEMLIPGSTNLKSMSLFIFICSLIDNKILQLLLYTTTAAATTTTNTATATTTANTTTKKNNQKQNKKKQKKKKKKKNKNKKKKK